ncbi:PhzF family phenazine biosynthesis protein [Halorubrum lacusprofundi]|jgi:PhzF family phenazine biosynthesis protein|uniref:Phenazine biosynthesis protein PhzF family n=1 Tax=Halorubrum lacusprofundi (strain ATCC 49239 / DSM 5036 / JCM 8891 / ACAM 34) TaxID=416348 RepID=B9LV26_HALLT|nr:PhzF family phenazine biosynthesis protein [Halorubrum lacusprofundi]ACM56503.1 phenazine biosynthesis protein PhzF family [Halorubrum lacusprofundi ATCC 49239]MCG1005225.1 PhzF family phenazine biosynthesis protein [Halorubrum lacusprofundi]
METRRTLLVDAFADEPLAGNVAGVVPDVGELSEDRMGRIAAELGASETAFLLDAGEGADERLRYFTPSTEVDLCGHATIATYGALFAEGAIDAGDRTLRTNVGDLEITIDDDGTVWMRQNPPTVDVIEPDSGSDGDSGGGLDADRLGDALGIDPAALRDVGADLPVAVASTGLPWLVVPVNFLERLGEAEPDMAAIEAITEAHDVAGVYAFTFDALDAESTLHGRAFAPAIGVPEDPVTGTASGAVGAYLREVGAFDGDFPDELRFEQGHFLDRPGHVRVRVAGDVVRVGGEAVVSMDGELRVPADDDSGEIIEA